MRELMQIQQVVQDALQEAGLHAVAAYPETPMKRYEGAVASVSVGAAEGKALGFCNYLGEVYDEDKGTVRERYGKQLQGQIQVEVRAERAADCEAGCVLASEVLLGRLPSGLQGGELNWQGIEWEQATGMFLRRGSLSCLALFMAETQEEEATFLDFRLKGVLK